MSEGLPQKRPVPAVRERGSRRKSNVSLTLRNEDSHEKNKIHLYDFRFLFYYNHSELPALYHYSAASLQTSLMRVARIQMDYAESLLEQKSNEIEIEADGILNSNDFRELQLMVMEEYDPYEYVMGVKNIKEYLNRRQKSNVGMAGIHSLLAGNRRYYNYAEQNGGRPFASGDGS